MAVSELSPQLRLLLANSPDAPSLPHLLQSVDHFVSECSRSTESDSGALLHQLEDDLQGIYHEVIDHSLLSHIKAFLSVLFHLRPILPPSSIISTWFDLVLRPALREPKLPAEAVDHAKELIIAALNPGAPKDDAGEGGPDPDREKKQDKIRDFRRRLMDLYLLDAHNESSGDDVLEWAESDDAQKERKACWKANLEDVLVRVGLQRPQVGLVSSIRPCFRMHAKYLSLAVGFTNGAISLLCISVFPSAITDTPQCIYVATRLFITCGRPGITSTHPQLTELSNIRQLLH